MKYIKLLSIIALLGVFASCEKNFEPAIGNTAVEFVNTEVTVDLLGSYHYIPVQMVEQAALAAKATVNFTGGMVEFKNGTKREVLEFTNDEEGYANGGDIIITSKTINVGAYDADVDGEGLPTNSFEVLIPAYKDIKNIELNFELTGNVGANSTTKYVAKVSDDILIGDWSFAFVEGYEKYGNLEMNIGKLTGSSYSVTIACMYVDAPVVFTATRSEATFTVEINGTDVDMSGYGLGTCKSYLSPYDAATDGFDSSSNVVFTIDEVAGTMTCTTGAIGLINDGSETGWYLFGPGAVAVGTVGTK